jgi:predicted RNA-binding protein YlxR (DUF448 family)
MRSCVGCRRRDAQAHLVRLAADGERIAVDAERRRPGRGVWVHRDPKCVRRVTAGALARGFKREVAGDAVVELTRVLNPGTTAES